MRLHFGSLVSSVVLCVACSSGDGGGAGGTAGSAGAAGHAGTGGGTAGSAGQGGGSAGPCTASDTMTWAGTTYHEQPSAEDSSVCDPQIMTVAYEEFPGGSGPGLNVLLHYGFSADASSFSSFVSMNVLGVTLGSYSYGRDPGQVGVTVVVPGSQCLARGGSLTLSRYDGPGGLAEGTFAFTDWTALRGTECPTGDVTGSFSMTVIASSELGGP